MPGQTALVANLVSQIIAEVTSLPRGVVNIFTESGNTGAPYLVASPDVQVVSYTGSTTVGRLVAAGGAATLKRMNLELGGKTPMIVFDDAGLAEQGGELPVLDPGEGRRREGDLPAVPRGQLRHGGQLPQGGLLDRPDGGRHRAVPDLTFRITGSAPVRADTAPEHCESLESVF
jgi:hypothetical protein